MATDVSRTLPRPSLVHLAISTWIIAVAALAVYENVTNTVGASAAAAALNFGLLVTQAGSTFARSFKEARICTWLLALVTVFTVVGLIGDLSELPSKRWSFRVAVETGRSLLIALLFTLGTLVSLRWWDKLSRCKAPPRLLRRYSLVELGVMVSSLCLFAALFADSLRPRTNYDELSEVHWSSNRTLAEQQKTDTEALAELLRPIVPDGWRLTVRGREVIMERARPIEIYGIVNLPETSSKDEERAYILAQRGGRRPLRKFAVVLWLDTKLTAGEYAEIAQQNETARRLASEDSGESWFLPNRTFWLQHPEYGYRRLPSFATDRHSVYMKINPPDHTTWDFLHAGDEHDRKTLLDSLTKLFPTAYHSPESAD